MTPPRKFVLCDDGCIYHSYTGDDETYEEAVASIDQNNDGAFTIDLYPDQPLTWAEFTHIYHLFTQFTNDRTNEQSNSTGPS